MPAARDHSNRVPRFDPIYDFKTSLSVTTSNPRKSTLTRVSSSPVSRLYEVRSWSWFVSSLLTLLALSLTGKSSSRMLQNAMREIGSVL